jgi:hypothetical protein
MPEQHLVPIDRIATDGTQTRAQLNDTVIREYAEANEAGIELSPIDVYFDGEVYWLADGFHRLRAAEQLSRDTIAANVHQGTQRDAIFNAVGANETHGLRRTNTDRRKAVPSCSTTPSGALGRIQRSPVSVTSLNTSSALSAVS